MTSSCASTNPLFELRTWVNITSYGLCRCKCRQTSNIIHTKSRNLNVSLLSCSCLCPIHWSQLFSREWRYWGSADSCNGLVLNRSTSLRWPRNAICRHKSWSTLTEVMACRLVEPMLSSNSDVLGHSLESNLTWSPSYYSVQWVWKLNFWIYCHISKGILN